MEVEKGKLPMKTLSLSVVINQEDDGHVALCTELDIASQGTTVEEAPSLSRFQSRCIRLLRWVHCNQSSGSLECPRNTSVSS